MPYSDFGTLCTIAGVTAKVINVEPPLLSVGTIETTNHSSANWREYIADTLKGGGAFKLTVEASAANVAQIAAVWAAFAAVAIVFTEKSMPAWSFSGLLTDFKYETANAQKPGEETVTITIQPTGAVTIAAAATNWYDDVTYLFTDLGGAYSVAHPATHQLIVYAVIPGLPPHLVTAAEMADIDFASSVVGKATIDAAGLITTVAAGDTVISAHLGSDATVETATNMTVT